MNKIRWVDGLKAILCWFVFFEHFDMAFGHVPGVRFLPKEYFGFMTCGNLALNVFFILAAFLATNMVFTTEKCNIAWVLGKVTGRYIRLALPLFFLNLVTFILEKSGILDTSIGYGYETGFIVTWYTEKHTFIDVLTASFTKGIFSENFSFNLSTWMMVYLLLGYYASVAIALLIKKGNLVVKIVIPLFAGMVLFFFESPYCVFCFGCLLYVLYAEFDGKMKGIVWHIAGLILLIGALLVSNRSKALVYRFDENGLLHVLTLWWHYSWMAAPTIVLGIILSKVIKKVLSTEFFVRASKIALPVFLFHELCMGTIGVRTMVWAFDREMSFPATVRLTFLTTILSTVMVGVLYSKLIDPIFKKISKLLLSPIARINEGKARKLAV